jgi:hypothetical protein
MHSTFRITCIGILFLGACTSAFADDKPRVIFAEKLWLVLAAGGSERLEGRRRRSADLGGARPSLRQTQRRPQRPAPQGPRNRAALGHRSLEVYVESRPNIIFEEVALYWYYDDDNYVSVVQERVDKEVNVRMFREKDGGPVALLNKKYEAAGVWLRLVIAAGKATGYYRQTDKDPWEKMGQADLPAQGEAKIGLNAAGGSKDTDRWAQFRDFRILEYAE